MGVDLNHPGIVYDGQGGAYIDPRWETGWYHPGDDSYEPDPTEQEQYTYDWLKKQEEANRALSQSVRDMQETFGRIGASVEPMRKAMESMEERLKKQMDRLAKEHQLQQIEQAAQPVVMNLDQLKADIVRDQRMLQRKYSAVYDNPERGTRKKDKFRDRNVGKVRGR